jgi:hypothetical protein
MLPLYQLLTKYTLDLIDIPLSTSVYVVTFVFQVEVHPYLARPALVNQSNLWVSKSLEIEVADNP